MRIKNSTYCSRCHSWSKFGATDTVYQLRNEVQILYVKIGAWHSACWEPSPASFCLPHLNTTAHISGWAKCSIGLNTISFSKVLTALMEDGSPSVHWAAKVGSCCVQPQGTAAASAELHLLVLLVNEDFRVMHSSALQEFLDEDFWNGCLST